MLTFQSVILTGVYDARNIRRKVRPVAYAADDAAVRNARIFGLVKVEEMYRSQTGYLRLDCTIIS